MRSERYLSKWRLSFIKKEFGLRSREQSCLGVAIIRIVECLALRLDRVTVILLLGMVLCFVGIRVSAAPQIGDSQSSENEQSEPELSFVTHLDQTAVWVGDQFRYQIFVDHSPTIQFILENLNEETISLDPLRILNVESSTMSLKNGNERLVLDLTLAHFTTGVDELQIPQFTLFYFRTDEGAGAITGDGAAAESLTIPGPILGVRSTLSGEEDLRDAVTVSGWPRARWIVVSVGWLALVLLIGGVAWESARIIRRRGGHEGPDPREQMAKIRDSWLNSVPTDFGEADTIMEFYKRSYYDLKEYLGYMLETHTAGLMADEMKSKMVNLTSDSDLIDSVGRVLDICETARYSRDSASLNGDIAQSVADDMQRIFKGVSPT